MWVRGEFVFWYREYIIEYIIEFSPFKTINSFQVNCKYLFQVPNSKFHHNVTWIILDKESFEFNHSLSKSLSIASFSFSRKNTDPKQRQANIIFQRIRMKNMKKKKKEKKEKKELLMNYFFNSRHDQYLSLKLLHTQ